MAGFFELAACEGDAGENFAGGRRRGRGRDAAWRDAAFGVANVAVFGGVVREGRRASQSPISVLSGMKRGTERRRMEEAA